MAIRAHSVMKLRPDPLLSHPQQYRRREQKIKTNKIQRKIKLKLKHILFYFLLIFIFFVSLQQLSLFLMSWNNLNISKIVLTSDNENIKNDIQYFFQEKHLGNLLVLDIEKLRYILKEHLWIKDVHIRKSFPSTLKIDIITRIPEAVIKKDKFYLMDREGILLEYIKLENNPGLPTLIDSGNFEEDAEEKLILAWKCLDSLSPGDRNLVDTLDLSLYENVFLRFKKDSTWLILGKDNFAERIQEYRKYGNLIEKFGPLEYADLSLDDRITIKPRTKPAGDLNLSSTKETK